MGIAAAEGLHVSLIRTEYAAYNMQVYLLHRSAHKINAQTQNYQFWRMSSSNASKPDIPPDDRWRIPMKYLIRIAFAALSLATIAPVANAATSGFPQTNYHSGPYDNTQNSLNRDSFGGGGNS